MKKTMTLTQRTSFIPSLVLFLPEVGFGELLHVQLLICEGGQVDISNSGEHFTWNTRTDEDSKQNSCSRILHHSARFF